ncbi:MAG: outer membrane lipoprotein chaperone LolA [Alcanivoracaceae bacterium]|nr:outer membrane lipoprotein chaperone LolA [Alcanivoracaceae bacterium]
MIKKIFASILLLPAIAMASPATDLVARLKEMNSLQGRFEQTVLDHGGTRLQEAEGDMVLARGNKFYWHTRTPFEQLAVSNGKTLWIYDVDLEQVVEKPMGERVANTPALLFGGDPEQITAAFSVEQSDVNGSRVTFRLKPKSEDPLFEVLEVTFEGNTPMAMRLEDALGQQTAINFYDLKFNKPIAKKTFHFEAPEGADVIRQSE